MTITSGQTLSILGQSQERLPLFLADLERVVGHESPTGDYPAIATSAVLVADLIEERLGVRPETVDIDGCHHLRLRFGTPKVTILTHHDTVWPHGTLAEIPFSNTDGVIRGPGCFDMKLGLIQAIHALALLRERGGDVALDGINLLVTGDEESGSITSRALIEDEARGSVAALVLEAAADDGALKVERKGVSIYKVSIHGRASHAGLEPEKGINAGVELAHQILAIQTLADPALGTSVTPTTLSAGTTTNTVPALATLDVDVRVRSGAEQERVDLAMRSLLANNPEAIITVNGGPNRPPMERSGAMGLFARAERIASRDGLGELTAVAVGGASDGNFTAGIGVPTLDGLGAVGAGAHARHEHALLAFIPGRTALVAALIEELSA
ncbi:M20 family metallopeptidase [Arthrobacter sp. GMC3]|uniref:M20 family metallopeptidase n=1 Tax=Arthrobacter sp. GMC3 TaxID=2058894 RepID=UPI000CE49C6D|nr:M20 family metallopeptidase [Arthrobacter sp. GMC3]